MKNKLLAKNDFLKITTEGPDKPYETEQSVVAIIGHAGSGKTKLAYDIKSNLRASCAVLNLDNYYKCQSHITLESRRELNYNDPSMINYELIISHINALKAGKDINMPQIDFSNYVSLEKTIKISPASIIIVEGSFVLSNPRLRALVNKTIYLSVPNNVCLTRCLQRDVDDRARLREYNLKSYLEKIRLGYVKFVKPYKNHCDYIIKTENNLDINFYQINYFLLSFKFLEKKGVFNMLRSVNKPLKIEIENNSGEDLSMLEKISKDEGIIKIVVGAVIYYKEKILIVTRSSMEDFLPNLNELPSGTVEPGETLSDALFREIKEETNLEIESIERYLGHFDYESRTGKKTRQFTFDVRVKAGGVIKLNPEEHSGYILHDPKNGLESCEVTPQIEELIKNSLNNRYNQKSQTVSYCYALRRV